MFNPMQTQAALQNKARFPDQKLQQYASGRPPQPTGQVTPPMAGGELAQRGADRQAFQNEAAMQADPSGRPPVLAEKAMQLQQQEQQLGMLAAMLAKKEQDIAAREQGIATLPMRPDMFTAMNGGIVFSGGGGVLGFKKGGDRGEMDPEDAAESPHRTSKFDEEEVPSTTGTSTGKLDPLQEIMAARRRITEGGDKAMLSEASKKELRDQRIAEMAAEFGEYEKGRAGREARMAEALRGQKPELMDFLGAMAAGGPKRTLGETLSAMVPGTQKLRAEQQARDMAAAKYLAEAEEKTAQAALAEKRGQRAAADKLIQEAQADRLKAFEVAKGVEDTGIRALTSVAEAERGERSEARRAQEAAERMALEREKQAFDVRKYTEEPQRQEYLLRLQAKLARENRPPSDQEKLIMRATLGMSDNEIAEFSKDLLLNRGRGAGADGRPSFADYQRMVQDRLDRVTDRDRKEIGAALGRKPTEKDIRDAITTEVRNELESEFGVGLFKGQGGRGSTPSTKTPPAVGTVMEGYKFKGGDPSKQENWEKI